MCSVSSPGEEAVKVPKSSVVEEKNVQSKVVPPGPPCLVNSYCFNTLCNKLQCDIEMSGNQTADQYRMEDNSVNSKAGSKGLLIEIGLLTETDGYCAQCGTLSLKMCDICVESASKRTSL